MLDNFKYGVAAVGATLGVQFLHPLDIIKTRMQSHDGQSNKNLVPKYSSLVNAVKKIYLQEGIRGFGKGIVVSLIANSVARSLFFIFYETKKQQMQIRYGADSRLGILYASLYASVLASLLTQPLWVTQTRMQLNTNAKSGLENVKFTLKQVFSQHGLKGYFRGTPMQILISFHGMVQINAYEMIYKISQGPFIAGMLSKCIAILATYPLTTIRTRIIQNQYIESHEPKYLSSVDIVRKISSLEGYRGFYKGIHASLLKGVPSKGIYFFIYEHIKTMLSVGRQQN